MTENYENDTIVFAKRLSESNDLQQQHQQQQNQNQMICNERAKEYIRELNAERNRMDKKFPIADRLIEIEIERVQATGRIPQSSREQKYADIYREKPLRITQKVLVPIREHPK
uniref:Uncharacterized protein n=1 Tax=Megaselia scalaris TaxID=36166 RepID=T1GNK3_MEGSC